MRRLQTVQKCNSTAVLLRHFFGCWGSISLFLLLFVFSSSLFAQNGVKITSSESPGPSSANPIPIEIKFEEAVNFIDGSAINVNNGSLEDLQRVDPAFSFVGNKEDLTSFNIDKILDEILDDIGGISGLGKLGPYLEAKLSEAVISIDFNDSDELFYLTYGNGLYKLGNPNPVIDASYFETPLDFVINRSNGRIYVADHGEKQILVFNDSFQLINEIGRGTDAESEDPRGTSGLALDKDGNIYNADNYTGETAGNWDAIKIYSPEGRYIHTIDNFKGDPIRDPLRIAVDNEGNIYLSDSGGENGRVLVYDKDYNPVTIINKDVQGSPGSLVTDEYGYLYVADFADDFDLGALFNDPLALLESFSGIENGNFDVKVYDSRNNYNLVGNFSSQDLDLPIDLAINSCGRIHVNNMDLTVHSLDIRSLDLGIFGTYPVPYDVDVDFDFNLKEFKREDNFTAEVVPVATGEVKVVIEDTVLFKCGPQPEGKFSIEYQAEGGEDTTDPVFTSCTNLTFPADIGECGAIVNYNIPEATDDSGVDPEITWISGPKPGDFVSVGETKTVVYRATDESENSADCSFTIAVTDNEAPVFLDCPNVVNAQLATGETSIPVNFPDPVADDNCSGFTVNQTGGQASGTQFTEGTHPIEFTVKDASGATAICQFNVIVSPADENLPPTLKNCPSDIDLNSESGICGAVAVFADPTAEDSENDDVSITRTDGGPSSGEVFPDGTTTVTYEASDGINPPVICSFDVTVTDIEDPAINCPSNIVENVAIGETGKIVNYSVPFGDNCPGASIVQTAGLPSESEFPVGQTITNTFIVTDAAGNTATCSFTVTINEAEDEEDPVISCPGNIEVLTDPGACGAEVEYEWPTATDNAGEPTISIIDGGAVSGSFFPVGETEIQFEAKDATGNTATCTLKITVKDEEPPEFTVCPQNSTQFVSAVNGKYFVPDLLGEVEAVDNCGNSIRYEQTPAANNEITQDFTVNIRAFDEFDNESDVCSIQLVLVQEDQPSFDCGSTAGLSLELDEDCSYSAPDFESYIINRQNFDNGIFIEQIEERLGQELQVNLKVYHGIDANSPFVGECNLVVTLEDNIPPELNSCNNSPVEVDLVPGENFVVPNYKDRISYTDNCSTQFNVIQVPAPQDVVTNNTTVTLTVEDEAGNVSTACSFPIVYNTPAVEINCVSTQVALGPNGTATLDPATLYDADPTSPAVDFFELSKDVFTCEDIGEQEVELIVHFVDGSSGSCTTKIEVVDQIKPVIKCREDFNLFLNEEGYGIISAEIILDSFSDNCEVASTTLSKSRFEITDVGENEVVVTVVDVNGNVETCETTINVIPYEQSGGVNCAESVPLSLDWEGKAELSLTYSGEQENIELELSKKDFTCDDIGSQMITASYYGEHTGSCEIEIIVVDDLPPLVNCTSEIDLVLDENGTGEISVNDVDQNSTDNCAIEDMSLSKSSFTSTDVGTQIVRFTVTDASGNSDFCEVTVNVKPYMATTGELDCVENLTLELDAGGEAVLTAQDLFEGDPGNAEFFGDVTYTCEDVGFHTITLTKKDDPSQSCKIEVEIVDNIAPVASCKADIELTLDINGTATLAPEDVDSGSTDNCEIASMSLDRTSFIGADLGEQKVTLTVTDASGNTDTCEANITILPNEENPSGVVCRDLITLDLDISGRARLNAQDAFSSGPSGTYYLSQTNFTCEDLGENEVILSYATLNGEGSCTVKVVVEDPLEICETPGPVERDTLILYPNPGDGLFKFEVSEGLQIHQIEVFDIRGRFLLEHRYDNSIPVLEYKLNLSEYQAGVYQLLIQTNGREYLKRAIIR
ncbi:HYR domain-containing protein [Salinimicrobium sediminilitoris]|uniref:HYR domain-containing protein n=1 Tax=Salinimicrobium sediminilitoris TaxID=2876715 RepID=UPI001E44D036|nr:HYR domain-containing protein [Salinimicrobium sediminilitoris]MCC8361246.1 HYR domain-containing protein [Salinimicrobium sediminilitoris]